MTEKERVRKRWSDAQGVDEAIKLLEQIKADPGFYELIGIKIVYDVER